MIIEIITFVIVLSVLVTIHELGHFFAAKRAGVWVEEFGFGLPPRVVGKKIGETIFSLNLFPFGGFVRLHGEADDMKITDPKRAFTTQKRLTRSVVITAGVIMNFLLATVIFAVIYTVQGVPRSTGEVKVVEVIPGSPAEQYGLREGVVVRDVNGVVVSDNNSFIKEIDKYKGKEVVLNIDKDNVTESLTVVPRENPAENEGALGVIISSAETYFPPIWQRPFIGIYYGFKEAIFWGKIVIWGFGQLVTELFKGSVPKGVSGPVGIFALTTEAAKYGFFTLLNFVGVLSVNLAIMNILPFPALDGGRLLFIGLESIFGRKLIPKIEAVANTVGIVILLTLLVAISIKDVRTLISAGGIQGFIDSVMQ